MTKRRPAAKKAAAKKTAAKKATTTRRRTPGAAPVLAGAPAPAMPGDAPLAPSNLIDLDAARALLAEDRAMAAADANAHPLFESPKTSPRANARIVLDRLGQTWWYRGAFYAHRDGLWLPLGDATMHALVADVLERGRVVNRHGDVLPFPATNGNVVETMRAMQALRTIPDEIKTPCIAQGNGKATEIESQCKVVARGAVVDPLTFKVQSSEGLFIPGGAEWVFDPNAPEPTATMAFLREVIPDDDTRAMLLEWFGAAMVADTTQQKSLVLCGPARGGKGVLLHLLTRLIGPSATVSPALHALADKFGLEPVLDKRLVTISDARLSNKADAMKVVEVLLRLIANDFVAVERKFLKSLNVRLGVNVVIATNALPQLGDDSPAIQSRFVIVPLTKSFLGKEDVGLLDKLLPELPGFALVCLHAYRDLHKRGRLLEPAASRDVRDQWYETDNPVKGFVEDVCLLDAEAKIPVAELHAEFLRWAESGSYRPIERNRLSQKLVAMFGTAKIRLCRSNGVRCVQGIRLKGF